MTGDLNEAYARYREHPSEENLDALARQARGMVQHFVKIYADGAGDDAVQAGYEGLLRAVRRFDPDRGTRFVTYAGHCIMGAVRHFVRSELSYRRPGVLKKLQARVDGVIEEHMKVAGEPPSLTEVADRLNVTEEGVAEAMRAGLVSLDELDYNKIQSQRHESFRLPIEDRLALEQAIMKLSNLQRTVVFLLFYRDQTQAQAGRRLGISQKKVSRVLHTSLAELAKSIK